jgi:protein-S-isoprenylcysteine O-methyltransferase Ste14
MAERGKIESNVKIWDKTINGLYIGFLLSMLVVIGFDARRFSWTELPIGFQALGFLILIFSAWLIWRAMAENAFASRWARVQKDREQQIITTGPYAFVRHPMYTGVILLVLSSSLAAGSLWGLLPGALISLVFILRTFLEDQMLKEELDGYRGYTKQVRYRLLPGIW